MMNERSGCIPMRVGMVVSTCKVCGVFCVAVMEQVLLNLKSK